MFTGSHKVPRTPVLPTSHGTASSHAHDASNVRYSSPGSYRSGGTIRSHHHPGLSRRECVLLSMVILLGAAVCLLLFSKGYDPRLPAAARKGLLDNAVKFDQPGQLLRGATLEARRLSDATGVSAGGAGKNTNVAAGGGAAVLNAQQAVSGSIGSTVSTGATTDTRVKLPVQGVHATHDSPATPTNSPDEPANPEPSRTPTEEARPMRLHERYTQPLATPDERPSDELPVPKPLRRGGHSAHPSEELPPARRAPKTPPQAAHHHSHSTPTSHSGKKDSGTSGSAGTGTSPPRPLLRSKTHLPPQTPSKTDKAYAALAEDILAHGAPSLRTAPGSAGLPPKMILRPIVEEHDISTSHFLMRYGTAYGQQPVKITGSQADWFRAAEWNEEALRDAIGASSLYKPLDDCKPGKRMRDDEPCHSIKEADPALIGRAWASLKMVNLTELGIGTFGQLFDKQKELAQQGRYLYAHEVDGFMLPTLEDRLHQPKYFRNCYGCVDMSNNPSTTGIMREAHFPSFFFGPAGSSSPLHTDAEMTRFWLLQLTGKKLVRLIAPSDNWRGDPGDLGDYQPSLFTIDLLNPDYEKHPNMAGLVVWEAVLEPGDILFIPEGWAHQALNLEWSAMISANYVDDNNAQSVQNRYRFDDADNDDAKNSFLYNSAFFLPLLDMREDLDNVRLYDFFRQHTLEHAAVSRAAREHIEKLQWLEIPPDEWCDLHSHRVLYRAVDSNYLRLAKWLVNQGVPLVNDEEGRFYLASAEASGYQKMATWMRRHMGLPTKGNLDNVPYGPLTPEQTAEIQAAGDTPSDGSPQTPGRATPTKEEPTPDTQETPVESSDQA